MERVMAKKVKGPPCIECGERHSDDKDGIYDMWGRFWCEDCLIYVLGNLRQDRMPKEK
jgi:hypothetical protein